MFDVEEGRKEIERQRGETSSDIENWRTDKDRKKETDIDTTRGGIRKQRKKQSWKEIESKTKRPKDKGNDSFKQKRLTKISSSSFVKF